MRYSECNKNKFQSSTSLPMQIYVAHNDETKPSIKGFFSVCQPNCNQKFKYFELLYTDFEK